MPLAVEVTGRAVGRYEFVEHTADIAVKAFGRTLAEAFASSAEAMFSIITDSAVIKPVDSIEIQVGSIDVEGLLVNFLSELIVIHETQNVVLTAFEVVLGEEHTLTCKARTEAFSSERHGRGTPVKGVSYHMMEIAEDPAGRDSYVQVLFDI